MTVEETPVVLLPELILAITAVVSLALIAVGVGLVFVPAGLVVAGVLGLAGTYAAARGVQRMRK